MVNALSAREAELLEASRWVLRYFERRDKGLTSQSDAVLLPRRLYAALTAYTDIDDPRFTAAAGVTRPSEDPAERDAIDIHIALAGFMEAVLKAQTVDRALRLSTLLQECISAAEAIQGAANRKADNLCR